MEHNPDFGEISRKAYRKGCRCAGCTAANTEYVREHRASHTSDGQVPVSRAPRTPGRVNNSAYSDGGAVDIWAAVALWRAESAPETWDTDSPGECPRCGEPLVWSRAMTVNLCLDCDYFASPVKTVATILVDDLNRISQRGIAARGKARELAARRGEAKAMLAAQLQRFAVNPADYQAYVLTGISRVREVLTSYTAFISAAQTRAEVDQLIREIEQYVNSETAVLTSIETGRYRAQPGQNYNKVIKIAGELPAAKPAIKGKCQIPGKHVIKPPAIAELHMSQGSAFEDYLVCDGCLHNAESLTRELGFDEYVITT